MDVQERFNRDRLIDRLNKHPERITAQDTRELARLLYMTMDESKKAMIRQILEHKRILEGVGSAMKKLVIVTEQLVKVKREADANGL